MSLAAPLVDPSGMNPKPLILRPQLRQPWAGGQAAPGALQ